MRLVSEIVEQKPKVLLISPIKYSFIKLIKESLEKLGSDFFYSSTIPSSLSFFEHVILIEFDKPIKTLISKDEKFVLIYLNNQQRASKNAMFLLKNRVTNIKIVNLSEGKITENDVERIIWFMFSTDKENYLQIRLFQEKTKPRIKKEESIRTWFIQSKKTILRYFLLFLMVFYLMVIPFQMLSLYFTYKSAVFLRNEKIKDAKIFLSYSNSSLIIAQGLYKITRPAYLLFSLALFPDNLFEISKTSYLSVEKAILISENGKQLISDIIRINKSEDEIRSQIMRLDAIISNINIFQKSLQDLYQIIPEKPVVLQKLRKNVSEQIDVLSNGKTILPLLKDVLGIDGPKKYLLLFANNMEIRPGGGFIGSYGILTVNNFTIEKIEAFDVYDADGQLKTHIDPPLPIRKYLDQPNWYLRDSAFSLDFLENYNQAKMFLKEEMNLNGFSGGIIITTSAIQNILEAMDEIYLNDYSEKITKDNFYIKAQLYAEKGFFPGSIQKKSFLGSLTRQILLNLDSASFSKMLKMLDRSLNEKQIAVVFEDQEIQKIFDSKYWSGKVILPVCLYQTSNCVIDYVFPVDANLGVNKSNFFVTKTFRLNTKISKNGLINNELVINIRNDSQNNIFPGGKYKNYFQLSLAPRSSISKITVNNTLIESYDVKIDTYKTIGFLLEVKPQKSSEIKIVYKLQQPLEKGEGIYQLIFQKQTGSKNSDLSLNIKIPENMAIEGQNFSPIVKEGLIIYNTSLTGDKIFILKLRNK
jgi:hypothetical protein